MKQSFPGFILILLLSFGFLSGCAASKATHSPDSSAKGAADESVVEAINPDLFPKDDGYACAIFFGAELLGSLDDCGCPRHPEGGLGWRMGYSNAFAAHSKGVPMLQVDAGYFTSDIRDSNGQLHPVAEMRNQWVLKAYNQMNFAVVNLSSHDLPYAERLFAKATYEKEKATNPILARLISANVHASQPGYISPPAYIIREVSSERLPSGQKLRVGFVGLTEPVKDKPVKDKQTASVFEIKDPLAAARRIIPEVRPQCDVLVALAYLSPKNAEQLAREVSGIDLIVNANQFHSEEKPVRIDQTTIAYARYQTRSLGEALIYVRPDGHLAGIQPRMVEMDASVPSDETAKQLVHRAEEEVTMAGKKYYEQFRQKANAQALQPLTPVPWQ
jgi:hypothetical protein